MAREIINPHLIPKIPLEPWQEVEAEMGHDGMLHLAQHTASTFEGEAFFRVCSSQVSIRRPGDFTLRKCPKCLQDRGNFWGTAK